MSEPFLTPVSAESQSSADVVVGAAVTGFLEQVAPAAARETLRADASAILTRSGVRRDAESSRTGLVVGRVQSGKTLSYEAVIALARDSGFSLVIVISGISTALLDQGVRRLKGDLTAAEPDGWTFLVNARPDANAESTLRSVRDNWNDPSTPVQLRKTAVCLLLKHHGRIDAFTELCRRIGWAGQKVLIIDDEADQASLNVSFRRNRGSATYRNIVSLRDVFPHHAYLQYTATPQAPLLVTITDVLSPDFVHVLEPGPAYVGGSDYFSSPNGLVKVISEADLQLSSDPSGPPPESLKSALREFILGGADVIARSTLETRSMLIHPSRLTEPHAAFVRWVRAIVSFWRSAIEEDPHGDGLTLRGEFEIAWRALSLTDPDLNEFEVCWRFARYVLRNLQIVEMNARDSAGTPVISWDSSKAYILVGGQALDRGFTVEGLSVTYMPRDPGGWTADTIQQRARFFGYKRGYLGQCRVYLEPALRDAFEMYVEHERHMIASLTEVQSGDSSLKEWKRHFLLDPAMRATRQSVTSLPTISVAPGERWIFDPRPVGHGSEELSNLVAQSFEPPDAVTDEYGHQRLLIPVDRLVEVVESLSEPTDAPLEFRILQLQVARLADAFPDEMACWIRMRPGIESVRTLTAAGTIQPFQGRSGRYPGDRMLYDPERLTIQFHRYGVRMSRDSEPNSAMETLAFRVPDRLASGWILEDSEV